METPKLEPTPLPAPSSQPPSPPTIELNPPSSSHKKGGKKAKRQGRNQYTKEKDTTSPTRKATASNSSGDENKSKPGEAATTTTAAAAATAQSKTSPNGSGQEAPAPVVKGKGRWKGKGRNAAAASDSDSKKDKSELTLKDMDRATQLMLDFLERNVPQQHIVTGHSMLRHASTPGMHGISTNTSSVASAVPDKPDEQLSSAEWADKLRSNIAEFRREFVTPTTGGLTV